MRDIVGEFVGPDIKARLSDFWGLDEEGEIRGAYKFSGCMSKYPLPTLPAPCKRTCID
jgi:hypothetical protein